MNPKQPNEETILEQALGFASLEERNAYLSGACAGDAALRKRVASLIEAHEAAGGFLSRIAASSRPSRCEPALEVKPADRIGRYKVLQQIGEGGCGVVYMAEQEEPVRRRVALKIIKLGMDTKSVIARFEAERQALALMDHPNIAKVFDAGATETGRPYFVMELVRGTKITDYSDEKNLSTQQRLDLFIHVCQAIQHAHQKGIIHRDIKPSNILVTVNDGVAVPKVIDFGIAKATTDQRLTDKTVFTAFEQFIGTPAYMSPEQTEITSVDVDTRSDIYSLGVLLYELLTGKTPFDPKELLQAGLDEMRRTIREREPERPSTRVNTLGADELTTTAKRRGIEPPRLANVLRGDLDWIVMKCLEKDRARRYATANGLAMDIQRHLSNEPVVAGPPSRRYRFHKMIRRNKGLVAALATICLVTIVAIGFVLREWMQKNDAYTRAIAAEATAHRQAIKSKRISTFLKTMLEGAGPGVAKGRDATVLIEILDQAAANISKELTNEPAAEAEMRLTIGYVYLQLGRYEKAEPILSRALEITKESFPEDNYDLALALNDTALALRDQGKYDEAQAMLTEAVALKRALLGIRDRETAISLLNLAGVLKLQGNLSAAEKTAQESLNALKSIAPDTEDLAMAFNVLAVVLFEEGKLNESEAATREFVSLIKKVHGPDDPEVAQATGYLGTILNREDKLDEAELLLRQGLSMQKKLLGVEHPVVAETTAELADLLSRRGRFDEAESLAVTALDIRRRTLGREHLKVGFSLNDLAVLLERAGKFERAEAVQNEALVIFKKLLGSDHPQVVQALGNLGKMLVGEGKLREANKIYDESLSIDIESGQVRGNILANRAALLTRLAKWHEAEADLTSAMQIFPDDAWIQYQLATLEVQTKALEAYEELCRKQLARFVQTSDQVTAWITARTCLIVPTRKVDLEAVARMTDQALKSGTNNQRWPSMLCTRALLEYRRGNFDKSLEWGQRALRDQRADSNPILQIEAHAVIAMAQAKVERREAAQAALVTAEEAAQTMLSKLEDLGKVSPFSWIISRTLLQEANELLSTQAPANSTESSVSGIRSHDLPRNQQTPQ